MVNPVVSSERGLALQSLPAESGSFSYKVVTAPKGFFDQFKPNRLKEIKAHFDINQKGQLVQCSAELNALICTVKSCMALDAEDSGKAKAHFCYTALKNATRWLNIYSEFSQHLKTSEVLDCCKELNLLLQVLIDRKEVLENEPEAIQAFLKALIQLVGAQIEAKESNKILGYLEHGKDFLYQQFWRYYEQGEDGFAKTIFFYYVQCLEAEDVRGGEKNNIEKAQAPLKQIFKNLERKSYVPHQCSDVREITQGMTSLIYMDVFLLDFLYQFDERIMKNISPDLFEISSLRIHNWRLVQPSSPEILDNHREVYVELLSATSNAKLNSVAEMQITCKNQVEFSTGIKKNVRVHREKRQDLAQKIVCENEVLTRLASLDRRDDVVDQRLSKLDEKTRERSTESDQLSETTVHASQNKEEAVADSLNANIRKEGRRSVAHQRAFEEGNRWQVNHLDVSEDGVEVAGIDRRGREHSSGSESFNTNKSQTVKAKHKAGWGFSLLGFISGQKKGPAKTVTEATEKGNRSRKDTSQYSDNQSEARLHSAKKQEHQKSYESEAQERGSENIELQDGMEQGREYGHNQKVVLLKKDDLSDVTRLQNKFGLRGQGRNLHEFESSSRTNILLDKQQEESSSVRRSFNFEHTKGVIDCRTEEYTEDLIEKKTTENTETFALKQGYLLISKAEYMRKTTLVPVKFVMELECDSKGSNVNQIDIKGCPDYLHPLLARIQSAATHRFHVISHDMKVEAGPITVKNLALEVWDGDQATHDRANQLNIIFNRLGRFLDAICDRPSETAWAQYQMHKNAYVEEASLKYCDDATRSLYGMFTAFQDNQVVYQSDTFLRLHSQFQGIANAALIHQFQLAPPNQHSGKLFHQPLADGIVLGQKRMTLKDSCKNTIVVGSSGSGKTTRIIIPNLLQLENCSILVTDVDGEIYDKTAAAMEKKGFTVKVINIQDEGNSGDHFNPLDHLGTESYDDIKKMVDCIMKARGFDESKAEKDAFWVIGGKMVLEFALQLVLEEKKEGKIKKVNLAALHERVGRLTKEEVESYAQDKKEKHRVKSDALELMAKSIISGGSSFADRASYAKSAVNYCSSPIVRQLTDESTLDLSTIRKSSTVIYLKIGQTQLSQYQFLLSLFYTRFFSTCYKQSQVAVGPGYSPLPVVCLMDEFGHTPIPDFHTTLTTNRKHEIVVVAVVQSVSQVVELYGEQNSKTMLGGGFASKLYFALDPGDVQIARDMSDAYGKVTARVGRTVEASGVISHREEETEGLTVEEVMYPGEGNATFVHTGHRPIKLRLTPYFEDERLQQLINEPAKPADVVERSGPLSKEEAMQVLISFLRDKKPSINVQMVKKRINSGDKTKIEAYLKRQGFPLDDQIIQLVNHICADRSCLLKHLRFQSLDTAAQESLRTYVDLAQNVAGDEALELLVEFLDDLAEKGFRISEVIALKEAAALVQKNSQLYNLILKDLYLQCCINKDVSRETIFKGLERMCSGFQEDETLDYWRHLLEYMQALLSYICKNKPECNLQMLLATACLERLLSLGCTDLNSSQSKEFQKIINELKTLRNLPKLLVAQVLHVQGQSWEISKVSVVPGSSISRIDLAGEEAGKKVKKVIRFDREMGTLTFHKPC